jgi:hypothetical protein
LINSWHNRSIIQGPILNCIDKYKGSISPDCDIITWGVVHGINIIQEVVKKVLFHHNIVGHNGKRLPYFDSFLDDLIIGELDHLENDLSSHGRGEDHHFLNEILDTSVNGFGLVYTGKEVVLHFPNCLNIVFFFLRYLGKTPSKVRSELQLLSGG